MKSCRIKILLEPSNSIREERLQYILDFIQNHPLAKGRLMFVRGEADLRIYYGISKYDRRKGAYFIPAQGDFFKKEWINSMDYHANTYFTPTHKIFSIEKELKENQEFLVEQTFSFDIFETIFFHISRYEEWNCDEADKDLWDMMQTQKQFLVKKSIHQIPVVDHLVFALLTALKLAPEPQSTTINVSHDIDEIRFFSNLWKPIRRSGGLILKRKSFNSQKRLWVTYLKTILGNERDPFDTFDWMISRSNKVGKVIYFLVGGKTKYDTPYDLSTLRMREIFTICKERGYTIGLHPSYAAWDEEGMFVKEKKRLEDAINDTVHCSRQHYLHFDFVRTASILEHNKIQQDSSIGFNECIGFRCGTGFPYQLYNFIGERPYAFKECPLVFMDSALFLEGNYSIEQIITLWDSFMEKNSHLTNITFNFHNSRFFDAWLHSIPMKERYEQILIQG